MTEVRELTPSELEAVAVAGGCATTLGCVECPKTVQEGWNRFFEAATLTKPYKDFP